MESSNYEKNKINISNHQTKYFHIINIYFIIYIIIHLTLKIIIQHLNIP